MPAKLFISYAHADNDLLEHLHKHLAQLVRNGDVAEWYDREITAGSRFDDAITRELEAADIFLACASPDWIASRYAYEKEFQTALEREASGNARIVPVVFRPCDWLSTPLNNFMALPQDGKAITEFTNQDVAFLNVVTELRRLIATTFSSAEVKADNIPFSPAQKQTPSRYRVKRQFDVLDKRDFVETSFEEIYRFFEASVAEISAIPEIDARLAPIENGSFSCTIINRGLQRGFETLHVRRGGGFGAIDIAYGEHTSLNTSSGGFAVEADEYQLMLKPILFRLMGHEDPLSAREAAKLLWDDLLSKVGIDYD